MGRVGSRLFWQGSNQAIHFDGIEGDGSRLDDEKLLWMNERVLVC